MALISVGDMTQNFLSARQNYSLKTRLAVLTQELSSGRVADLTRHFGGDSARLAGLDRSLTLVESHQRAARETGQFLATMQLNLGTIDSTRNTLSGQLITINSTNSMAQLSDAASSARSGFGSIVQSLNGRFGDKALFAGTATDGTALRNPDQMLTDIRAAAAGLTTAADVIAAIETWFDDPVGGFATAGYLGDSGANLTRTIDSDLTVTIAARADNSALRDLMKAAAIAAIADAPELAINDADRAALLRDGGERLLSGGQPLAYLRAGLGASEARIEEVGVSQTAQMTTFATMRNIMVAADPYDAATALQLVQTQLETHYMLTARLSQLTLAAYLR
jgi:flagellar hook-associated protein 3 FlgL